MFIVAKMQQKTQTFHHLSQRTKNLGVINQLKEKICLKIRFSNQKELKNDNVQVCVQQSNEITQDIKKTC